MVRKYFLFIPLWAIFLVINGSGALWASKGNIGLSQTDISTRGSWASQWETAIPEKKVPPPAAGLPLKQLLLKGPPSANHLIVKVVNAFRQRYQGPEVSSEELRFPPLTNPEGSDKTAVVKRPGQQRKDIRSITPCYVLTPQEIKMLLDRFGCQQSVLPGQNLVTDPNLFPYIFPVAAPFTFRDSWGDPRSGGRHHLGVDIYAQEGTEVYAITNGVIHTLANWPEAGITILLQGRDGKGYGYMHLQRYAEGMAEGKAVKKGELIGYVGRTGMTESKAHLHFQYYPNVDFCKGDLQNAYDGLVHLCGGLGVTDLNQHKFADLRKEGRLKNVVFQRPETRQTLVELPMQENRNKMGGVQVPESRVKVAGPQFKKNVRIIGGIQIQETGNKIIITGLPGSVTLRERGNRPRVRLFNGKEDLM